MSTDNSFQFRVGSDGKLEVNMNLWGFFNMMYGQFQIAVENARDNVDAIVIPNNPSAQKQARSRHARVLGAVRRYLAPELQQKGFSRCALGPNEAIALFEAIRATLDRARGDEKLQATESTCIDSGFTGLLNRFLCTGTTVDKAISLASRLSDDELICSICEDINLRAIREAKKQK
jgi:hypothetical protein